MPLTLHTVAIDTFVPMLETLSELLGKGAELARAKKFDFEVLSNGRLAPDMFPLTKHVHIACDNAQSAIANLTGSSEPEHVSSDASLTGLQACIARTVEALKRASIPANDEERKITVPMSPEMRFEFSAPQFLLHWAIPQFYFHVVTAYAILRHNGADIGMTDYGTVAGQYMRTGSAVD